MKIEDAKKALDLEASAKSLEAFADKLRDKKIPAGESLCIYDYYARARGREAYDLHAVGDGIRILEEAVRLAATTARGEIARLGFTQKATKMDKPAEAPQPKSIKKGRLFK